MPSVYGKYGFPLYHHGTLVAPKSYSCPTYVGSPFVPTVRPPLYLPTPLSPAYVQPLQITPLTPWTQPLAISPLPPCTPILTPGSTVMVDTPYTSPSLLWFPDEFEPGTFPALPFGTPAAIRINPLLLYNPVNPCVPTLEWDISHRAEQAKQLTGRQVLVTPDLSGLATFPAVSNMWIYSDHPVLAWWMELWGPIVVEKHNISTCDVLDAIWEYMRKPLTDSDVRRVVESGQKIGLERSARRRIGDGFDLKAVALRNGYRRVDVLGSVRKFLGLRVQLSMDGTWNAFMGLAPGPVAY